jgi:hypothetical protein
MIFIHDPPLAVQAQPLWVVTITPPMPALAVKVRLVGDIEYVQGLGVVYETSLEYPL